MLPIRLTGQQPSGSDSRGGGERGNLPSDPQPPPASRHREQERTQSRVTAPPAGREAEHKTAQWHSNYQSPPRTAGGAVFTRRWRRCRCSQISFCLGGSAEGGRSLSVVLNLEPVALSPSAVLNFMELLTEHFQTHTFMIRPIFQKDCLDLNSCVIFSPILCTIYQCFLSVARLHLWTGQKREGLKQNTFKQHHESGSLVLFVNQARNKFICTN